MQILKTHYVFGGTLNYLQHHSAATKTSMKLSVFVPNKTGTLPTLTWLSGLTCTEDNFTTKAGAYKVAAELGMIIVAPDTSPRGDNVPNDTSYDLGQGAGFYLDATQAPWSEHFNMYSYITHDLQEFMLKHFPVNRSRQAISGHSMGGHGALTIGLKNPELFKSISAFAPIVAPSQVPWGQKAFAHYIGDNKDNWQHYDACELVKKLGGTDKTPILIDQGLADDFYETELKPELFQQACSEVGQKLTLRLQEGYDHSYFFMSSFIDDHLRFHHNNLCAD
ncbi:S-formylglutathione hydrolase [Gammaproteobacteria bacterium AH-315-C21]|nr:S-formylglutathione hydrolase [Gammaproteobacteria bacterium AH-315-C21]